MQWTKFDYHLSEFFYYANVIVIAEDAKKILKTIEARKERGYWINME